MGLKERIQADMQKAAKERNSLALSALRMALAAIKKKEIEERGEVGERGRLDPQGARHDGEATEGVDRPLPAGGQGGPRRERGGGDRRPGGVFAEGALGRADRNPSPRGGGGRPVPGGVVSRGARGARYGTERTSSRWFPRPFVSRGAGQASGAFARSTGRRPPLSSSIRPNRSFIASGAGRGDRVSIFSCTSCTCR